MPDRRARRLTLIACILGSAIVFVDGTVVNVALPALRSDLGAALAGQQWVVEGYLLMLGALVLVGGSLGDVYGRRRVFIIGTAAFGATSLLCAAAPTTELLIGARALQGIAAALLVPSSLAIITTVFPEGERAAAIGQWTAWTSAAIAAGPPLGGLLVDALSWRAVFAINVPLVAGCLYLAARAMPECPGPGGRRIDLIGAGLCALALGGPVFALIRQPDHGWDAGVLVPLAAGALLMACFLAWERRHPDPMLPLGVFAKRNFAVGNAATFATYAGLGSATFFIALFLQQVAGYSAAAAGLALVPITLMLIALSRRMGALAERTGPRMPMGAGPLVAAAGLLLALRIDADAAYVAEVLPAVLVFGLGLAITVAPLTSTVLAAAPREHAGIASGVNNAVARVAGLIAIAGVGAVIAGAFAGEAPGAAAVQAAPAEARSAIEQALDSRLSAPNLPPGLEVVEAEITDAAVEAFHAGMLVSAVLVALGGFVSLAGIENRRPAPE